MISTGSARAADVAVPLQIKTVLFDLDGTLADTAPDLADALNAVRLAHQLEPLPFEVIRPAVSHGGKALIELGFGLAPVVADFEQLRQALLQHYADNIANKTTLFPGMAEVIETLEQRGCNWGVVTNKPGWLTEPLMAALGLLERAACIVSGDSLPQCKPHPAPLLHACQLAGSQAPQCVYVGDAERDISAGRDAGMHTLVALFGYIGANDDPQAWGADALIRNPRELLHWLDNI